MGGFHASVIHTPGHTPGVVTYMPKIMEWKGEAATVCGDTLQGARPYGFVRLMEQIMESLRDKLMQLPDDTLVHPGHGGSTTIGLEKEMNPFLK